MTHPSRLLLAAAALILSATAPSAQPTPESAFISGPEARGTAYFVFAEPGAPTFEVVFLGAGTRNGIYRFQEGTTFVQALALAGGTATSDSTELRVVTSTVRLLRDSGTGSQVVYAGTPERLLRDRARLPALQDGDVIETEVTTEIIPPPKEKFTFLNGLDLVARVASVVSVVLFLVSRR